MSLIVPRDVIDFRAPPTAAILSTVAAVHSKPRAQMRGIF
jgi:hypothetical protein